jgi:subtilase family serine protease
VTRGAAISISDTTRNGGGGGSVASTTRLYLSTNASFDAADTPLGARTVPGLAAGATSAGSSSVVIPAATAPGTYYVIARADDAGAVGETAENNNTRSMVVKVNP